MPRKRRKGDNRKRTKSGQLSRAGQRVKPSPWVQARIDLFGNHYSSALGRAYAMGFLGEGSDAKARLDAGNKFVLRYSKIVGGDSYTCPLSPKGGSLSLADPDKEQHQQDWLFAAMNALDRSGARPWLDQLISKEYVDTGPYWLDQLIEGKRTKDVKVILDAAVKALDIVLSVDTKERVDIPLHMCNRAVNA